MLLTSGCRWNTYVRIVYLNSRHVWGAFGTAQWVATLHTKIVYLLNFMMIHLYSQRCSSQSNIHSRAEPCTIHTQLKCIEMYQFIPQELLSRFAQNSSWNMVYHMSDSYVRSITPGPQVIFDNHGGALSFVLTSESAMSVITWGNHCLPNCPRTSVFWHVHWNMGLHAKLLP